MALCQNMITQTCHLMRHMRIGGVWTQTARWRIGPSKEKRIQLRKEREDFSWLAPIEEYKKEKSEQVEEPPQQLHVVWRVKTMKGRPWWEKEILKMYGLDEKKASEPVIVKNTPTDNRRLREVKHLLRIRPLKAIDGMPENEADLEHYTIKSNGHLVHSKKPQSLDDDSGPVAGRSEKWALTKETVKNELEYKKRMFEVHSEYFPTTYRYKRNQDGKEYRYNFSKEPVLK